MERKIYGQSKRMDGVAYDIRGPVMDEAMRMERQGEKIIKLNIGNPAPFSFFAPEQVLSDMARQLHSSEGYSASNGLPEAREAIVGYCRKKGIPNVGIDDVFTGNGVSELITMTLQALLNDGDEVLVPAPDYPLWSAAITLVGGKAVHYLCDEQQNWFPDIADLRAKVTDRTRGIVVINPNNPTGALYPRELLEQIVQVARENDLLLFADEIYDRLVMEGEPEHVALASLAPDLMTLSFNGLSKSHRVAGFRCGWVALAGDKSRASGYIQGINTLAKMRLCSNVPAQSIIAAALAQLPERDPAYCPGGRIWRQRELIWRALNDIPGVSAVKPQASFYIFPRVDMARFHIRSDEQMALDLLKRQKILVTAGTGFHWPAHDHFRIVYLPEEGDLLAAAERFRAFFADYRQD
ncbi:MAG: pyridoxal phosphate-dependent aminotransferase [Oscillospiraceae bacterium]|nr:pyridoxal phosphate-dependent aminotransferase [Oscillospiraceae bacterium]